MRDKARRGTGGIYVESMATPKRHSKHSQRMQYKPAHQECPEKRNGAAVSRLWAPPPPSSPFASPLFSRLLFLQALAIDKAAMTKLAAALPAGFAELAALAATGQGDVSAAKLGSAALTKALQAQVRRGFSTAGGTCAGTPNRVDTAG